MKKINLLALALCLLLVCTTALCACGHEEPDERDDENQSNNVVNQVVDEEQWREIIFNTINFSDIDFANFTLQATLSAELESGSIKEMYTWMCADGIYYEAHIVTLDENNIIEQRESYANNKGGCYRNYNTEDSTWEEWIGSTSDYLAEHQLAYWANYMFSSAFNFFADYFNKYQFLDGIYTAENLVWELSDWQIFDVIEINITLIESRIKSVSGLITGDEINVDVLNFLIEFINVGSTKITMPKV